MLTNVEPIDNLRGLALAKARDYETRTVHSALVEEETASGWSVERKNRTTTRIRRPKQPGTAFEDRVWTLLYRMGFRHMSTSRGATLGIGAKGAATPGTQIDVIGIDDDVVIAIECKASANRAKRPQFQEELGKHAAIRQRLSESVVSQFPADHKRQLVLAMFLSNAALSDNDRARAAEAKVLIFEDHDLEYYESLVGHIGPAAKYQFFADMLPGKTVPGLAIRVPAVRTKMGGSYCYTFSLSPERLLKIAYVSHRSKGKASDVHSYQRMLNKGRLNRIRQYITNGGIFPTNIVVNLDNRRLRFERIHQETESMDDPEAGLLGWLDIKPTYKSAWIIDGQHRLYAYSGHPRATSGKLSVLAFEGLLPSKQAELFIDINAKQKSVRQSLLQELYAELHWDADEPEVRVRAIISKAIQVMDANPDSPLYQRIQTADSEKDHKRCITLTSVFGAVAKYGFHIAKERHGTVLEYGPLWAGTNDATLGRTVHVLNYWMNLVRAGAPDWWEKGSGEGGGLAMNDGVITCVNVLRSVCSHLDSGASRLVALDNQDLCKCIDPYGAALRRYFGSLSEDERKRFRDLRGTQGQTTRTRRCQQAIQKECHEFIPPGLEEFMRSEKAQTNAKAKKIIDQMEVTLQRLIVDELQREFGQEDSKWWMMGVPKQVRQKVSQRFEDEDGKRGGKEYYFDLIDYRQIAVDNWGIFAQLLGYGKSGSKDKRTSWLVTVNERRKVVSHASSAVTLTVDELSQLEEYDQWLCAQVAGKSTCNDEAATDAE